MGSLWRLIQDLLGPEDPEDHVLWEAIRKRMEQWRIRGVVALDVPIAEVSMQGGGDTLADAGSQPVASTLGGQAARAPITPQHARERFFNLPLKAHREAGAPEAIAEAQRTLWAEAAKVAQGAEEL